MSLLTLQSFTGGRKCLKVGRMRKCAPGHTNTMLTGTSRRRTLRGGQASRGGLLAVTDPADALRDLAADVERDALDLDPETPVEHGLVEGMGRAVGRAKARADELDTD